MGNRLTALKLFAFILLFCSSAGPFVVIENYGNWKTLSIASKTAYITGLWDGYMVFTSDNGVKKKFTTICKADAIIKVSDLLEVIDNLYEKDINRNISPAGLLKQKGLERLCSN